MTKILNFALKIKGGGREGGTCEVLRPCHPPPKFGTCTPGSVSCLGGVSCPGGMSCPGIMSTSPDTVSEILLIYIHSFIH